MKRWLFIAMALSTVSCSDPSQLLTGAPCPCVPDQGYICCPTTQLCVAAEACPAFAPLDFSISQVQPTSGQLRGGESIEVRGHGFEPDMEIRIGGVPCLETIWRQANNMTCTTPPGPALNNLVSVSVHRTDGASVVRDSAFRYQLSDFSELTGSGIEAGGFGTGLALWDANLDGRDDLIFAPTNGIDEPALFLNRGGLHFEPQGDLPWIQSVGRFSGVVVADFTQDGRADLFVANHRSQPAPHLLSPSAPQLSANSGSFGRPWTMAWDYLAPLPST